MPQQHIMYSDKYYDENYEYRHVQVPPEMVKTLPKKLMTEDEWRNFGIQQSHGWVHYMIHEPEPHILLFRRPIKGTPPTQEEQFKMEEQIEAEAEAEELK